MVWKEKCPAFAGYTGIAMTSYSEERAPIDPPSPGAQIVSFERPPNALQRAVQQRAQEHMEALQAKPKVSLLRRVVTLLLAAIPVFLLLAGFLVAVQAVRFIAALYANSHKAEPPAQQQEMPVEPSRPGLIMLVPDRAIPADPAASAPAVSDQAPAAQPPAEHTPPTR